MENVENVDKLKTDAENRVKSGIKKDYVAPFFWLHNEGRDSLLEELDAVQRSGISSVC